MKKLKSAPPTLHANLQAMPSYFIQNHFKTKIKISTWSHKAHIELDCYLFIPFVDSQQSKLNHYTCQEPHGEDIEGSFRFRCGRKTTDNKSKENPRNQAETENPVHTAPLAGFEPGS